MQSGLAIRMHHGLQRRVAIGGGGDVIHRLLLCLQNVNAAYSKFMHLMEETA